MRGWGHITYSIGQKNWIDGRVAFLMNEEAEEDGRSVHLESRGIQTLVSNQVEKELAFVCMEKGLRVLISEMEGDLTETRRLDCIF